MPGYRFTPAIVAFLHLSSAGAVSAPADGASGTMRESIDGSATESATAAIQDGVEVYIFVASRDETDLGHDGPHRLTRANAALMLAEYRRRVVQQHGASATVRPFATRGTGTCLYVYRNERRHPGRILVVNDTSKVNADARIRGIQTNNGGDVILSPQCAP